MDKNKLLTPDQFAQQIKDKYPQYKDVSNADLANKMVAKYPQYKNKVDVSSIGGNSTGDQGKDLNLQQGDNSFISGLSKMFGGPTTGTPTKTAGIGKKIADFFTGATQAFGENIGSSIAAPENVQKYSDALQQHNDITQSVVKAISAKKKLGQDTSHLENALKEQLTSVPQISQFVDQTTLRRLSESFHKNLEEVIGQGIGTGLESLSGGVLGKGTDTALATGKTLGSKIFQGLKIGGAYGAVSGAGSGLSKEKNTEGVVSSAATGAAAGAAIGAGAELAGGAIANMVKGRPTFGSLAAVPEKSIPALENVQDAENIVREAQTLTKENIKNPDKPSASEVQGSQLHSAIIDSSRALLKEQGDKMGAILDDPKVGGEKADITPAISEFDALTKKRSPTGLSRSQSNDFAQFQYDLTDLKTLQKNGKLTIKQLDDFLRDWQPRVNDYKGTSLAKPINSTVNALNEIAKSSADAAETAAGIEGHPYRESNDEYRKLVTNILDAEGEVGEKNPGTGNYDKSDKVYRQNATRDSSKALKYLSGKTGIPLGQPAVLTKAVEDIYAGEKPDNIIADLHPSFSLKMTVLRSLRSFILKNEKNPDAIVDKMLQIIKDSKSK